MSLLTLRHDLLAGSRARIARGWSRRWRYGGARWRERLRRKLLEVQPVAWLACRERWQSLGVWAMVLVAAGAMAVALGSGVPLQAWVFWNYIGRLFILLLYLWVASQSCRFFVEARRSGLIELLLATPISEREIVRGHWGGLRRMFIAPVLLLLGVYVSGATLSQLSYTRMFSAVGTSFSSGTTNKSGMIVVTNRGFSVTATKAGSSGTGTNTVVMGTGFQMPGRMLVWAQATFATVATALASIANLLALCWFGMWMGMTSRTANLATLKTMLFVQVVPWFIISFGSSIGIWMILTPMLVRSNAASTTSFMVWWPLVTTALNTGLAVGKDVVFILWSRKKLYTAFREQATQVLGMVAVVQAPRAPAPVAAPPIIPVQTS